MTIQNNRFCKTGLHLFTILHFFKGIIFDAFEEHDKDFLRQNHYSCGFLVAKLMLLVKMNRKGMSFGGQF